VGVFYLCLHTVGLVRIEVVWVCFDVLFFISEFHFLFLLIFILFWLACIYLCCWCFPLGVYLDITRNFQEYIVYNQSINKQNMIISF
jgi:hypothetical protein